MSTWNGQRITLSCGHIFLYEAECGPQRIGALTGCDLCPLRWSEAGRLESMVRLVVNLELITLDEEPGDIDPHYWH